MSKPNPAVMDDGSLEQSSELLRAIAHPLRLKILEFIDKHESINVNKIYSSLKLEQSITSQHLRILRLADVVITEREGKFVLYRINYERLQLAMNAINNFLRLEK